MANAQDVGDAVALMLEGLALSESSLRCTLTWKGVEYPCTGGPEYGGKRIDEGGWREHAQVKIKVRVEVFADPSDLPQEKQTILYKRNATHEGRTLRIDQLVNWYGAFLELHCCSPAEGM